MALIEKITCSIPEGLPEVEALSVENNQRIWCVYHQTYAICNIDSFVDEGLNPCPGSSEWVYRRRTYSSLAGTLMLLEPGEIHRNTKVALQSNFSVALIAPELVDEIASEADLKPNPHFREAMTTDAALYRAFLRFHACLADETTLLHRRSLLVDCIGLLLSGQCERDLRPLLYPGRQSLRCARDFLEDHFAEPITLEQLAAISGLSRFHFLRAFTREFSLPPHSYQMRLRIERARLLLQAGMPVREIELGFADQSHLTRHFKRVMGVTPGEYAAMVGTSRR